MCFEGSLVFGKEIDNTNNVTFEGHGSFLIDLMRTLIGIWSPRPLPLAILIHKFIRIWLCRVMVQLLWI